MNPNETESLDTWQERREECRERHGNNGFGIPLGIAVRLWPTPAARDWKGTGREGQLPTTLAAMPGMLNPDWVTQLQGFPDGWLDVGPPAPASPKLRGKRRVPRSANSLPASDRLKALGNAVVPQQAAPIFWAIAEYERKMT